jgi:hypothetical protein
MAVKSEVFVGAQFGRLTVIVGNHPRKGEKVICRCECGKEIETNWQHLGKYTRSCGCLMRETCKTVHRTHGMGNTRTYRIWCGVVYRCTNPNSDAWADYGGRGITVCDRWLKFVNFYADMGECPTDLTIEPKVIVLHFTDSGPGSYPGVHALFNANTPNGGELPGVCAHYVVDQDGTIYQQVPLDLMCRHAIGVNDHAIGIEMIQQQGISSHWADQQILEWENLGGVIVGKFPG